MFVPIDKHSNQSMGFAFITFMMPEHAVQAFNELDGHVFQGRLLHILPSKPKRNTDTVDVVEGVYFIVLDVNAKSHSLSNERGK